MGVLLCPFLRERAEGGWRRISPSERETEARCSMAAAQSKALPTCSPANHTPASQGRMRTTVS